MQKNYKKKIQQERRLLSREAGSHKQYLWAKICEFWYLLKQQP